MVGGHECSHHDLGPAAGSEVGWPYISIYVNDFIMITCDFQQPNERKACSCSDNGSVAHAFCRSLTRSKDGTLQSPLSGTLHASELLTADKMRQNFV